MCNNFLRAFKAKLSGTDEPLTREDIESIFSKKSGFYSGSGFRYVGSLPMFAEHVLGLDEREFDFFSVTPEDMQRLKDDMLAEFDKHAKP
jgi:hypothetical protein